MSNHANITAMLADAGKAIIACDVIAEILKRPNWDADTLDTINEIIIGTGRSTETPDTAEKEPEEETPPPAWFGPAMAAAIEKDFLAARDRPLDEERHPKDLREGDRVNWTSQWAGRDAAGRMITYHGILEERSSKIPGWFVRRDDGRRVQIRSALLRREPPADTDHALRLTDEEVATGLAMALQDMATPGTPLTVELARELAEKGVGLDSFENYPEPPAPTGYVREYDTTKVEAALAELRALPEPKPFDAGHPIDWPEERKPEPPLWLAFYLVDPNECAFPEEIALDVQYHETLTDWNDTVHVRPVVIPGDPLDTDGLAAAAKYAGPGETLLNVFEYPLTQITRQ